MYVPLLEALLQKDFMLSMSCVEEYYRSSNDDREVFKAIFVYASQHSANGQPDALTISWLHWLVVKNLPGERAIIFEELLSYLNTIDTNAIDTQVFKPDPMDTSIVSIHDLYDIFEEGTLEETLRAVGRTLNRMDNKNYFTEIMTDIALTRSSNSIILTRAFYEAVETLGWRNHFTPFLIHHLVVKIHADQDQRSKISTREEEALLLARCLGRIRQDSINIKSKLISKIESRMFIEVSRLEFHSDLLIKALPFV